MPPSDISIHPATDSDVEGVCQLIADRVGPLDADEARSVLTDPGFERERWTVAVDRGRIVSTAASFGVDAALGVAPLRGTQIEFVATASDYEGRGLVRRQLDRHHDIAERSGEVVQIIVGIPYFYRRFGYDYAIPMPGYRAIDSRRTPATPAGWETRRATLADVPAIMDLQRAVAAEADFQISATPALWSLYLASPACEVEVAHKGGLIGAAWRMYEDDGDRYVLDLAGVTVEGLAAAGASLGARADYVLPRPGTGPGVARWSAPIPTRDAYYARIADPVAFLDASRPELERRLTLGGLGDETGELLVSLYGSSLRIRFALGAVAPIVPGPGVQAPVSAGGAGVPPDVFTSLVLGPWSVDQLDRRHPDFLPGSRRETLAALFPPVTADLHTWVPP